MLQDSTSNLLSDTEPQAAADCSMLLLWLTASEDHLFVLCPCHGLKALHLGRGCSQGVGFLPFCPGLNTAVHAGRSVLPQRLGQVLLATSSSCLPSLLTSLTRNGSWLPGVWLVR